MKKRTLTFKFSLMFAGFTLVTIAAGSILYEKSHQNPKIDASYENIFKRADAAMYKAKKEMKGPVADRAEMPD